MYHSFFPPMPGIFLPDLPDILDGELLTRDLGMDRVIVMLCKACLPHPKQRPQGSTTHSVADSACRSLTRGASFFLISMCQRASRYVYDLFVQAVAQTLPT